jgi:ectoine hydroxylase-related dioxygenase (phytanoyl-CoA dioxygenase family)
LAMALSFEQDGAVHHPAALATGEVERLRDRLDVLARPGRRLTPGDLADLKLDAMSRIAGGHLGREAFAVRAVLFDKTQDANWIVAWHQDRTIPVRERIETAGFGPWSTKAGVLHVAPAIAILEGMATLRLHLDDCHDDNAPLHVALGSHRLGLVPADQAHEMAEQRPRMVCHAAAGDVWAYSTPILHTSARSQSSRRRRVLQVDYATEELPGGLQWVR